MKAVDYIKAKKSKKELSVKFMRCPKAMGDKIARIAKAHGMSQNEFMIMGMSYFLVELKERAKKKR